MQQVREFGLQLPQQGLPPNVQLVPLAPQVGGVQTPVEQLRPVQHGLEAQELPDPAHPASGWKPQVPPGPQ